MSGHSHFSSIKHKKAITDAKRGKMFSKLARQISIAAQEKGGNPETNAGLRLAIEKAKSFNMPKQNIERAIKKGSGEIEEERLEEVVYEAYGPGGIALIIEGITDNKNRSLGEIKQALNQYGGKMANEGAVKWMFERKGIISLQTTDLSELGMENKEELELKVIEAGAEDIRWHDDCLDIYTKTEDLEKVKKNLEEQKMKIESTGSEWVAKSDIQINEKEKETAEKLFSALDESESVQEIYSNFK